jgi:hypothetical protein
VFVVGVLFLAGNAGAQGSFVWRAALDSIRQDGFYQVLLTPPIVAKCVRPDLADLRILGPDNRFVSYVLKDPQRREDTQPWLALPRAILAQKDSSNKHSYIDLRFSEAFTIDRLAFEIRDPVFYKRDATVLAEGTNGTEWTSLTSVILAPNNIMLSIPTVKTRRLRIDIANGDNAPLVVTEISSFQKARYLIAYLKAGGSYEVLTGNALATPPEYDLKYFTDSLRSTPSVLVPGPIRQTSVSNIQPVAPIEKKPGGERSGGLLLWSILLAILILLVYFSVQMTKAIKKKERHDRV